MNTTKAKATKAVKERLKDTATLIATRRWSKPDDRITSFLYRAKTDITVYKRVLTVKSAKVFPYHDYRVIKLTLTKGTFFWVNNGSKQKCRAFSAVSHGSGVANYDQTFRYKKGQVVECDVNLKSFKKDPGVCAPGIHFFLDKHIAEIYNFS